MKKVLITLAMILMLPMFAFADQTIIEATRANDIATVKKFLDAGGNVNTKNQYGGTALLFACRSGYIDIIKLLLANKADVNVHGSYAGTTALMWAAQYKQPEAEKLLIGAKVEINAKNHAGQTALYFANENKDTVIINLLKNAGAK